MAKRKATVASSDEEEYTEEEVAAAASSSPERPIQSARRSGKKAKKQVESDEESEQDEPKPAKKPKVDAKKGKSTAKPASIKKPNIYGTKAKVEEDHGDVKVGVNEEGEKYVDLGKKRRATVRQYKGSTFLDIREFYGDDNDLKPGKKGVSINKEQWEALKRGSDAIDSFFAKIGK